MQSLLLSNRRRRNLKHLLVDERPEAQAEEEGHEVEEMQEAAEEMQEEDVKQKSSRLQQLPPTSRRQ